MWKRFREFVGGAGANPENPRENPFAAPKEQSEKLAEAQSKTLEFTFTDAQRDIASGEQGALKKLVDSMERDSQFWAPEDTYRWGSFYETRAKDFILSSILAGQAVNRQEVIDVIKKLVEQKTARVVDIQHRLQAHAPVVEKTVDLAMDAVDDFLKNLREKSSPIKSG